MCIARPPNTRFNGPTAITKRQLGRFRRFCTADATSAPYVTLRRTISLLAAKTHSFVDPPDPLPYKQHKTHSLPTDRPTERRRNSTGQNRPLALYRATRPNKESQWTRENRRRHWNTDRVSDDNISEKTKATPLDGIGQMLLTREVDNFLHVRRDNSIVK